MTFLSPSVFAFPVLTEAYILTVVLSKKSIMEEIKISCNDCWGPLKTGFMVVHHFRSTHFEQTRFMRVVVLSEISGSLLLGRLSSGQTAARLCVLVGGECQVMNAPSFE